MSNDPPKTPGPHSGRASASAEASAKAERDRIAAMTPLQRMALALALGRRHAELRRHREGAKDQSR